MRRYFLPFFFLYSLMLSATSVIDEVVWIVGDEPILRSEVEEQRLRMQYEDQPLTSDPYCSIPEEMAVQKLLLNQARVDSLSVNRSAVQQQVDQRLNYFIAQIGSRERLESYFGKSIATLRDELHTLVEEQMLAQQVQQSIVGDIKVTPHEVQRFFDTLPSYRRPMIPMRVDVQILTLTPEIPVVDQEAIKSKLREFKTRVEKGEINFSTLAILYSEDKESAKQGGELGFMKRGMLVPEFAEAAFALSTPGRISPVVETEYGYHIIQLIERRGDELNCRHILLRPAVTAAARTTTLSKLDSLSTGIRKGKRTFEEAVTAFSSDKKTRMNGGVMTNPNTLDTHFEYQDLPTEVARMASTLAVGEVSRPFIMIDEQGREVCAIIKLRSRTAAHQANLEDDFTAIRDMLREQLAGEALEKWILSRQREVYVHIKDGWRNCTFKYPGWLVR